MIPGTQGSGMGPGMVVMQYVDDQNCFVGIVVDDRMIEMTDEHRHFNPTWHHVCLVLGWFSSEAKVPDSVFQHGFPRYRIGEKRTAVAWDSSEEEGRLARHFRSAAHGIGVDYLWLKTLGPTPKQREVIELAVLARKWVETGGDGHFPEHWMRLGSTNAGKLNRELNRALPTLSKLNVAERIALNIEHPGV